MRLILLISLFLTSTALGQEENRTSIENPIKNWGLINSLAKSHIDAPTAWTLQDGKKSIVVAVIDTGIDVTHKDLAGNIWHDPKHPSHYGWDFMTNTPNPIPEISHGTHVAGIIGASLDLQNGVSGVTHHVSLMSLKFYSDYNLGYVNLQNTVKALNYAIDHGARIINYSGGGPEFSESEYLAMKRAESKGILVVAAAGNDHRNTDLFQNYYYPAAYRLTNIIAVAATDVHNNLLLSSNWGATKVDVCAPGENIYSTLPRENGRSKFGYMSGTSQATAFVSGLAALLLSQDPHLTPQQIKKIILKSVDKFPQLQGKVVSGGRINAYQALVILKNKSFSDIRK